ncbi:MAG: hypothetical protein MZV70_18360 [Desulfobacterales bacterium]|nr:hypothetical protein [Desulfobacterales bacterium]
MAKAPDYEVRAEGPRRGAPAERLSGPLRHLLHRRQPLLCRLRSRGICRCRRPARRVARRGRPDGRREVPGPPRPADGLRARARPPVLDVPHGHLLPPGSRATEAGRDRLLHLGLRLARSRPRRNSRRSTGNGSP